MCILFLVTIFFFFFEKNYNYKSYRNCAFTILIFIKLQDRSNEHLFKASKTEFVTFRMKLRRSCTKFQPKLRFSSTKWQNRALKLSSILLESHISFYHHHNRHNYSEYAALDIAAENSYQADISSEILFEMGNILFELNDFGASTKKFTDCYKSLEHQVLNWRLRANSKYKIRACRLALKKYNAAIKAFNECREILTNVMKNDTALTNEVKEILKPVYQIISNINKSRSMRCRLHLENDREQF